MIFFNEIMNFYSSNDFHGWLDAHIGDQNKRCGNVRRRQVAKIKKQLAKVELHMVNDGSLYDCPSGIVIYRGRPLSLK